ncbi:MAG: glycerophosphodiester phosphodiesterase [Gammaproteobacteria bacterium]
MIKLPFRVDKPFRIIAHRGASAYAPENTLSAFQLAVDMGVKEIELDVQLTLDGEIVICHDLSLQRYGFQGVVEELNWPDLAPLDMGSWFSPYLYGNEQMLRLQDLFTPFGFEITYHIELKGKSAKLPDFVSRLIDQYDLKGNVIITSFSYEILKRVRRIDPDLRLGWLIPKLDPEIITKSRELELFQICLDADSLTEQDVERAHSAVPEVRSFGITGSREKVLTLIQKIIDAGCDGTTLDWPDWIIHR